MEELMSTDPAIFNPLQQGSLHTAEQLGVWNKRFPNAFRKYNDNLIAMSATGDGNCFCCCCCFVLLFCSISLLLFGFFICFALTR